MDLPHVLSMLPRDLMARRRSGGSIGGSDGIGGAGGDVLSLWLLRKVTGFVGQLKAVLPLVEDGASLRGLLEEVRHLARRDSPGGDSFVASPPPYTREFA